MALGGGTFLAQNKVLPGAYINFVSAANASATLSDRGIATMPLVLEWGEKEKVFEVTKEDFLKNSTKIFGYPYTHEKMKGLRDLFKNIRTLYAYGLPTTGDTLANHEGTFFARHFGAVGNNISFKIEYAVGSETEFVITTKFHGEVVASCTCDEHTNGWVDNDYMTIMNLEFIEGSRSLKNCIGEYTLTDGANGTISGSAHQKYLDAIESYSYNTMGVVTSDDTTKGLYEAFCKRMREEIGAKFQLVLYNKASDYEGVINVKNKVVGADEASLVYWVTGISAGCEINKSNLNKKYDGEFRVNVDYTQTQLEAAIKAGEFTLHRVGSDVRVLDDINSLVTTSDTKGDIFKENQTIRVIDQIANDVAVIFNTEFLGVVPNDKAGRTALRVKILTHHEQLQNIRAIEDFNDEDVKVAMGDTKKSVVISDAVTPVNAMAKLYMTTVIS